MIYFLIAIFFASSPRASESSLSRIPANLFHYARERKTSLTKIRPFGKSRKSLQVQDAIESTSEISSQISVIPNPEVILNDWTVDSPRSLTAEFPLEDSLYETERPTLESQDKNSATNELQRYSSAALDFFGDDSHNEPSSSSKTPGHKAE